MPLPDGPNAPEAGNPSCSRLGEREYGPSDERQASYLDLSGWPSQGPGMPWVGRTLTRAPAYCYNRFG